MRSYFGPSAVVLLILSGAGNIAFSIRNAALAGEIDRLRTSQGPAIGSKIAEIAGSTLEMNPAIQSLSDHKRPSLVLVFSPSCHFCAQNWPEWDWLTKTLSSEKGRMIFINIGPAFGRSFIELHHLSGKLVFSHIPQEEASGYGFIIAPETIVLDSDGVVRASRAGVLTRADSKDLSDVATKLER